MDEGRLGLGWQRRVVVQQGTTLPTWRKLSWLSQLLPLADLLFRDGSVAGSVPETDQHVVVNHDRTGVATGIVAVG